MTATFYDYLTYLINLDIDLYGGAFKKDVLFAEEKRANIHVKINFTEKEAAEDLRKKLIGYMDGHGFYDCFDVNSSFVFDEKENHITFNLSDIIGYLRDHKPRGIISAKNDDTYTEELKNTVKQEFNGFIKLLSPYGLTEDFASLFFDTNFSNSINYVITHSTPFAFFNIKESYRDPDSGEVYPYYFRPPITDNRESKNMLILPRDPENQRLEFVNTAHCVAVPRGMMDESSQEELESEHQEDAAFVRFKLNFSSDALGNLSIDNAKILRLKESEKIALIEGESLLKANVLLDAIKLMLPANHDLRNQYPENKKFSSLSEFFEVFYNYNLIFDVSHSRQISVNHTLHITSFFKLLANFLVDCIVENKNIRNKERSRAFSLLIKACNAQLTSSLSLSDIEKIPDVLNILKIKPVMFSINTADQNALRFIGIDILLRIMKEWIGNRNNAESIHYVNRAQLLIVNFLDILSSIKNKELHETFEDSLCSQIQSLIKIELLAGKIAEAKMYAEFFGELNGLMSNYLYNHSPKLKSLIEFTQQCSPDILNLETRYLHSLYEISNVVKEQKPELGWITDRVVSESISRMQKSPSENAAIMQCNNDFLTKLCQGRNFSEKVRKTLDKSAAISFEVGSLKEKNILTPMEKSFLDPLIISSFVKAGAENLQKSRYPNRYNRVSIVLNRLDIDEKLINTLPQQVGIYTLWEIKNNSTITFHYSNIWSAYSGEIISEEQWELFRSFMDDQGYREILEDHAADSSAEIAYAMLEGTVYYKNKQHLITDAVCNITVQASRPVDYYVNKNIVFKGLVDPDDSLEKNDTIKYAHARNQLQNPVVELGFSVNGRGLISDVVLATCGNEVSINKQELSNNIGMMSESFLPDNFDVKIINKVEEIIDVLISKKSSVSETIQSTQILLGLISREALKVEESKKIDLFLLLEDFTKYSEKLKTHAHTNNEIKGFVLYMQKLKEDAFNGDIGVFLRYILLYKKCLNQINEKNIKNSIVKHDFLLARNQLAGIIDALQDNMQQYAHIQLDDDKLSISCKKTKLGYYKGKYLAADVKSNHSSYADFLQVVDPEQISVVYSADSNEKKGWITIAKKDSCTKLYVNEYSLENNTYLIDEFGICRAKYDEKSECFEVMGDEIVLHTALSHEYSEKNLFYYRLPPKLLYKVFSHIEILNKSIEDYAMPNNSNAWQLPALRAFKAQFESILKASFMTGIPGQIMDTLPLTQPNKNHRMGIFKWLCFSQKLTDVSRDLLQEISVSLNQYVQSKAPVNVVNKPVRCLLLEDAPVIRCIEIQTDSAMPHDIANVVDTAQHLVKLH